jgi:hypothetical protein
VSTCLARSHAEVTPEIIAQDYYNRRSLRCTGPDRACADRSGDQRTGVRFDVLRRTIGNDGYAAVRLECGPTN